VLLKIYKFLGAPESNEEVLQPEPLLRIILYVALSLSFVIAAAVRFFVENPLKSLLTVLLFIVVELIILIFTFTRKIWLASLLFICGLSVLLLGVTYFFGGVEEIAYSAWVLVILSGGLLLGRRYIWIVTFIGVFGGLIILVAELDHHLPLAHLPEPRITWVSNVVMFIWSGVILHVALRNIETAVQRIREESLARAKAYDATLEGWSRALELRDHETWGHSERVVAKSVQLARELGLQESVLTNLKRGALLHDIGKMGIPDAILTKPGPLSTEEWDIMHRHPGMAKQLLDQIEYLRPAIEIPYSHHEKWDGSGYPYGLKGEEIPLAARIFAVVDVWDALLSERPYRKAWPEEKVLTYILEQSGKHFDPRIVQAFLLICSVPAPAKKPEE
jgi:hypothetical protein